MVKSAEGKSAKKLSRRSFLKLAKWTAIGGLITIPGLRDILSPTYGGIEHYHSNGPGFSGDKLKVMSCNIAAWRKRNLFWDEAVGFRCFDVSQNFEIGREYIRQVNPDILLTQEDTTGYIGNHNFNSFTELRKDFSSAVYGQLFKWNYLYRSIEGGSFGNAIYSKFPLYDSQLLLFSEGISPFEDLPAFGMNSLIGSKGTVTAGFDWKGQRVYLDNLHLGAYDVDEERALELEMYMGSVFNASLPRIFGGDFNTVWKDSQRRNYAEEVDHTDDRSIEGLVSRCE